MDGVMIIRSAKVDELAQRLARLTGEDIETALERAIEERRPVSSGQCPATAKPRSMLSSSAPPS